MNLTLILLYDLARRIFNNFFSIGGETGVEEEDRTARESSRLRIVLQQRRWRRRGSAVRQI